MQRFKHLLLTSLLAMTSVAAWADVEPQAPTVGDGSEAHPYELSTPGHMLWLKNNFRTSEPNATSGLRLDQSHFVLTADIDLSEIQWRSLEGPIVDAQTQAFTGVFDGQRHTISHLHGTGSQCALFYYVGECVIKNLTMADVSFSGDGNYAAIAYTVSSNDKTQKPVFYNITVSGNITTSGTGGRCGGIMSSCYGAEFYNCTNHANITLTDSNANYAGGMVGQQHSDGDPALIDGCVNTGAISAQGYVGGLAGSFNNGNVSNSLNLGTISGNTSYYGSGGIVGEFGSTGNESSISYCLNLGTVIGGRSCSHIVGAAKGDVTMTACLWDTSATLTCNSNNAYPYCGSGSASANYCVGVGTEEFASGYAAYLLQGTQAVTRWGQNIGTDDKPRLSADNQVYLSGGYIGCDGQQHGEGTYTNTPSAVDIRSHEWHNGICSNCGTYTAAPLVSGYYEVANAGHLLWLRNEVNVNHASRIKVRQVADIDLSSVCGEGIGNWEPIGNASYTSAGHASFDSSEYDGQNYTISGLYDHNDRTSEYFAGLFGYLNSSQVHDLRLAGVDIEVPHVNSVGALAGDLAYQSSSVTRVTVTSGRVVGNSGVGGIVGYAHGNSSISDCSNGATVSGSYNVGGIVGRVENSGARVSECYNGSTATITATTNNAGGIVGSGSDLTLTRCTNLADVTCQSRGACAAGIVAYAGNTATITDSYSAGTITTEYEGGGIAGNFNGNELRNCLFTGNVDCTCPATSSSSFGLVVGWIASSSSASDLYYSAASTLTYKGETKEPTGCYYPSSPHFTEGSTAVADLENGALAFKLQGVRDEFVWGQDLSRDRVPVINTASRKTLQVYVNSGTVDCRLVPQGDVTYSNTLGAEAVYLDHVFDADGICIICGHGQEPTVDDGIYQIANAGNLMWFRDFVNEKDNTASAQLIADIDLSNVCGAEKGNFAPFQNFCGNFNGQDFKISGFYFDNAKASPKLQYMGLFGIAGGTATTTEICNLELEGTVSSASYDQAAILVGQAQGNVAIHHITTRGKLAGRSNSGAIVGNLTGSATVNDCVNYASVNGDTGVAGIVGTYYYSYSGPIAGRQMTNVANYGDINGSDLVGGIIGYKYSSFDFTFCNAANYGNVSASSDRAAGIVATNNSGTTFDGVFLGGNVSGERAGLIVYKNNGNRITRAYYDASLKLTAGGEDVDISVSAENGSAIAMTHAEVEAGRAAAYLGTGWGQTIGVDKAPVIGGQHVWYGRYLDTAHADEEPRYTTPRGSNTEHLMEDYDPHHYNREGVCTVCGKRNGVDISFVPAASYEGWTSTNKGVQSSQSENVWTFECIKTDNISFDWKVSSESGCDKLTIYVKYPGAADFVKYDKDYSGENSGSVAFGPGTAYPFTTDGTCEIKAVYKKDGSVDEGSDEATIYNVVGPGLGSAGILADLNNDTANDINDVNYLRSVLTRYTKPADAKCDFNGDGRVTIADLNVLIKSLLP